MTVRLWSAAGRFVGRNTQAGRSVEVMLAAAVAPLAKKGVRWILEELLTGGLAAAIRFMRQQGFYRAFIESQVRAIKDAIPGQAIEPEIGEYLIDLGVGLGGDASQTVFDTVPPTKPAA